MNVPVADALTTERLIQSLPGKILLLKANAPDLTIITLNNNLATFLHSDIEKVTGRGLFNAIAAQLIRLPEDLLKPLIASLAHIIESVSISETVTGAGIQLNLNAILDDKQVPEFIIISLNETAGYPQSFSSHNEKLFMHSPFGIAMLKGHQLKISFVNNVMKQIWKLNEGDYKGRNLSEAIPDLSSQGYTELLIEIMQRGATYFAKEQLVEYEHDGQTDITFFEFTYQPFPADGNNEEVLMIYAKEVTDHIEARKVLEEREKRLQIAIDSCDIGVWDISLVDNSAYHSLKHDRIFGYDSPVTEWSIHHFFSHIHEDDKERVESNIRDALEHGILKMECKLMKADGEPAIVSLFGKVFYNEHKEPIRMIGTIADITGQKKIAESLNSSREELERGVRERTTDLQEVNINLQHSNKKLEEFVYAASHDLQEPLRKLITYSGILTNRERERFSESGKETLTKITNAVERMQLLIKDLSDLSDTAQGQKIFSAVDLDVVATDVISELMQEYDGKPAEVRKDKLPVIKAVPLQMKQLFENLISNALKFSSHSDPPVISISSRIFYTGASPFNGFAANSSYIELIVTDNGIGFEQEYESKIFQLFQRLHNKSDYPGTGIGLAICRNIAENHNGFIRAEGNKGKGATFHVFLKVD